MECFLHSLEHGGIRRQRHHALAHDVVGGKGAVGGDIGEDIDAGGLELGHKLGIRDAVDNDADAVIGDYFARNYDNVVRVGFLGADCVTPIYGVMVSSNATLSKGVSDAVTTISKNGVLRVIIAKWLGADGKSLMPGNVDLSKLPARAFGV